MHKNLKMYSYVGLALIALTVGLLFVPGFIRGYFLGVKSLSGYNFIFGYYKYGGINYLAKNVLGQDKGHVSGFGITSLVFLLLAAASLVFQSKSSILSFFGGLFIALTGVIYLMTPVWCLSVYSGKVEAFWLAYVLGGILLAYGAFLIFLAVLRLKEEKDVLATPKSHQYSYLKKDNK